MQLIEKQNYTATIMAAVSATQAFTAIASVQKWWAKNFEGSARKQGDQFTVRFGETFVTFEISECMQDRKIVWRVLDCWLHWQHDKKEWNGTQVVWELSEAGGQTQIKMTHVGLTPGVECYDNCNEGWNGHIKDSLYHLLTEGKGQPQ